MTIEFQTSYGKVPEKLIAFIRGELLELKHIQKKITRAEVSLRENILIIPGENKACEINLSIPGANLYVYSCTDSFERSANETIKDLKRLVKLQVKHRQVPGKVFKTV